MENKLNNLSKKEIKELKAALTLDEIEVINDIHELYKKFKKLHKDEPFAIIGLSEVASNLANIENAVMARHLLRAFPTFFKDIAPKKNKKGKNPKKSK